MTLRIIPSSEPIRAVSLDTGKDVDPATVPEIVTAALDAFGRAVERAGGEWFCECGHLPHNRFDLGECSVEGCECIDWSEYDPRTDGQEDG